MRNEKQIKSFIRKIVRKAKQDWTTGIYVSMSNCNQTQNLDSSGFVSMLEKDIINSVLCSDETIMNFVSLTTGRSLGSLLFVFDYDSEVDEIINDYTDNQYCNFLISHAESK